MPPPLPVIGPSPGTTERDGVGLVLYDLSSDGFEPFEMVVPGLDLNSTWAMQNERLVVSNASTLFVYDVLHQKQPWVPYRWVNINIFCCASGLRKPWWLTRWTGGCT